jgi:hypothetical protein
MGRRVAMADEDFFSDDDFEDIPDNTLQELERNAISSTQRPKAAPVQRPVQQPQRKPVYGAAPLNRAGSLNKSNVLWRPPQPKPQVQTFGQPSRRAATPAKPPPPPPSSDYGFDDEDVVDLNEPSTVIPSATGLQNAPAIPIRPSPAAASLYSTRPALDPETEAVYAAADAELGTHRPGQWSPAPRAQGDTHNGIDASSLQARIAELEAEQARLKKAEQDARNAALAKQGEIAIVRANQEKAAKEYERRIEVMKRTHADEAAKQRDALEATRKENQKMQTNNRFLQHDLAQEAERAKRLNGAGKTKLASSSRAQQTPPKARRPGLGDGFDEDEVQVVSPSKSRDRPKDQTPKHATKRKRIANDSPAPALSFTQPAQPVRQESNETPAVSAASLPGTAQAVDKRFEFTQSMLNHCPYEGHGRSVEALGRHVFPSDPSRTAASALMDLLARPAVEEEYYPLRVCRALFVVWSQCLEHQFYSPLYLILDLVQFTIYLEVSSNIAQIIEEAVPVCIASINLVAVTMARASASPAYAAGLDRESLNKLVGEVGVDDIMDLLLRICHAASLVPGRLEAFWRVVDQHFTLLMLNKAQPISQIEAMLQILATSALPTTFGPIDDDMEKQPKNESNLVDRLTTLLMEKPQPPQDEPPYGEEEMTGLRLEVLKVLRRMCQTDHGGSLLASHTYAIGRLFRFLSEQVDKMYSLPPTLGMDPVGSTEDGEHNSTARKLVAETVNTATRIIYHILRTYEVDVPSKFRVIHGGYHKFIISMTRIAFSEQLVFEQGIENEVADAAHAVLNDALSPEEGEAVGLAFETPKGTRGSDRMRAGFVGQGRAGSEEILGDGDAEMSEPG